MKGLSDGKSILKTWDGMIITPRNQTSSSWVPSPNYAI